MRITVKLFAGVREAGDREAELMELPDGSTVADAESRLRENIPSAAKLIEKAAFAVNRSYARRDTQLQDGDELAVLPPVSGG